MNSLGLKLVKHFEGCRLEAYLDQGGVPTIGYGHIKDVVMGLTWTQEQAEEALKEELDATEEGVKKLVKVKIDDNQLAALTSFAYNVGLGNLQKSTLLRWVNKLNQNVTSEFLKWNHVNGRVDNGLTKRRQTEADLFAGNLDAVNKVINS